MDALAVPLLHSSSNSEMVLAEVCAAMAVLASEGKFSRHAVAICACSSTGRSEIQHMCHEF